MQKALIDGIFFERICFTTIITLHAVSAIIGVPILIPMFNTFNKNNPTSCAGDETSKKNKPTPAKPTESSSWFGGKTQNQKDSGRCAKLADKMSESAYRSIYQHQRMDSEDGTRTTHNISSRAPGFGVFNFCLSLPKKYDKKPDEQN